MIVLLFVLALVLASCGPDTDEGQDAEPTGALQASVSPPTATGSSAASPAMEIRTDYEVPPFEELVELFEYDTSEPLGFETFDRDRQGKATVHDVTYRSSGYTVPAWLVIPDGAGPFPAVLYAHGAAVGTRDWFLEDALALARDGYAGLLIMGPANRDPYLPISTTWDAKLDIEGAVQYAIDLRRGIDLLETFPEIDADRLGFVGYSAGGWEGAYLSGLEDRIDAYVLASTGGDPCTGSESTGWSCRVTDVEGMLTYAGDISPKDLERYLTDTMALESSVYVACNEGAAFLFQASKGDVYVPPTTVEALFEAAPEPKAIEWYEGGHELGCMVSLDLTTCRADVEAYAFHRAWLQENV